jgi:hypothetical protein
MQTFQQKTRVCVVLLLAVFVAGTLGFMAAERLAPIDAAYFAVVTMSTVGYGDISPGTQGGKLVAVLFILSGVGTFMVLVASATEDILNSRDRRVRRDKCHMLSGLYFSEIGNELLDRIAPDADQRPGLPRELRDRDVWTPSELRTVARWLGNTDMSAGTVAVDLGELRTFLESRTTLLLRLLENPALLENESFTELLRAVFHLREELAHRADLAQLAEADRKHISGDIHRVHERTVPQWIEYMEYLQEHYPYLFSLAVRTNPFDGRESAAAH